MLRLSRCTVLVSILTAYLHGNEGIACMRIIQDGDVGSMV